MTVSWKAIARGGVTLAAGIGVVTATAGEARADGYRPPELSWGYGEIEGARSLAMGGAVRALGMSTSAISANPGNLGLQHIYHLEGLGSYDTAGHDLVYGAAVVDSYTSRLAMGVLAAEGNQGLSDPVSRDSLHVDVGLGFPLGDKIGFGVAGRYLRVNQSGAGPLNESTPVALSSGDPSSFVGYTFDAGLSIGLGDVVHLAAVGYNLTNPSTALAPLMVGGGLGLQTQVVSFEADLLGVDRSTWGTWKARLQLGGELLAGGRYPIRLGYGWDQSSSRHALSGGIGILDRQWALEAGLRQEIVTPNDGYAKATVMTLSVRYFYENGVATGPTEAPGITPPELAPQ
jgi:hypothetical protein